MPAKPKKHTTKRTEDGCYEYRGFEIERQEDIPSGYYGAWKILVRAIVLHRNQETLKAAKAEIDRHLRAKLIAERNPPIDVD